MKVLEFAFDARDEGSSNDYLPHNYHHNCVVYTGTHDNETLAGWINQITKPEKELVKSISSSTVLPYNYRDINMIYNVIRKLSSDIGKKLRNNKLYADTIGIWFKYNYFDKFSRQEKLDVSIATDEEIYNNSIKIFNDIWNHEDGIRSICVFVSGLSSERKKQLSIFDIDIDDDDSSDKLQGVIDDIKNKYGDDIIKFANIKETSK